MKRPITLYDKIRIFIKWLKNKEGFGLVGSCDICESVKLQRLEHSNKHVEETVEYYATYKCLNCGAVASAKEVWKKRQPLNNQ